MFVFEVLFLIGAIGFGTMVFLAGLQGLGTHAASHHGHQGLHTPSSPGDHHAAFGAHLKALHGHGKLAPGKAAHGMRGGGGGARFRSLLFLSPLDVFAMCLGAGTVGLSLRHVVAASILPWLAILGALLVDYGIVRPLLSVAFQFASKPSESLEDTVARSAKAISRFDQNGRGLVSMTLDGQTVQLLAQLDADDRAQGIEVHRGDEVVVVEIDAHRNACRVTRQLSP